MTIHQGIVGGGSGSDLTAIHKDTANEISTITEKTTLLDTDIAVLEDSGASGVKKKFSFLNLYNYISGKLPASGSNEHEYDIDSENIAIKYIGIAPTGTLTSETGWTITQIELGEVGIDTVLHATGIYDNRESLIYT